VTADALRTIIIERATPAVDDGRFPIKREVGDTIEVEADIYKEGHDKLGAAVLYRLIGQEPWQQAPMGPVENDRWAGSFQVKQPGRYQYTVEAWTDLYGSWIDGARKKFNAGEPIASELLEGLHIVTSTEARARGAEKKELAAFVEAWHLATDDATKLAVASDERLLELTRDCPDRSRSSTYDRILEVVVDPVLARYGSWYEMFPRSQGTEPTRGSTFRECERRLGEIQDLGFNVLYMPPIHPIGLTNRKGKNNATVAKPGEPGSPYAIGSAAGGHMAVEPSLGTLEDFDHFVRACNQHGLQVALDFAIQCSPDHPYVTEHPEWFAKRPDGTIKYAENPPKKYQDIYPLDFYCAAWESLWHEMLKIVAFWLGHGVKIFRVDNPHTKPVRFWKWFIERAKEMDPQVLFFAEAFTRPKMMRMLAKAGFTQSYTYFTWRNTKQELAEYLTELTRSEMREYFRGNFFVNTPDILPEFLQTGGRPAFKIRAVLAATLCSNWGIYNGFELCEADALPGREEYANSEKYEFKVWDWDRPGNIKPLIKALNRARAENPALQEYDNLKFFWSDHEDVLVYGKATPDRSNIVLVVVNLNPRATRATMVHIPPHELGLGDSDPYVVHDLLTDQRWVWRGTSNYVRLDPNQEPAHVFVIGKN
jgi:starch synthase (maltosyl-transferring)